MEQGYTGLYKGTKILALIAHLRTWLAGIMILASAGIHAQVVGQLPLHLFPTGSKSEMVVFLTGDGGWSDFNQELAKSFSAQGYSVVVWNSRKYFWSQKNPDIFAKDMALVLNHYMGEWKKSGAIIAGYSFGADVLPFLAPRMGALKNKISMLALISPSSSTDYVIHISDLLISKETLDYKYKTLPELQKGLLPVLCIFGKEEQLVLKKELKAGPLLRVAELPGNHRFHGDANEVVKQIIDFHAIHKN